MPKKNLSTMSFNELWHLHEEVAKLLVERIFAETRSLEKRLEALNRGQLTGLSKSATPSSNPRGKYPRVLPKYRNPLSPSETWSGRGKTPRWLLAALKTGHKIEDFRIVQSGPKVE